MPDSQDGAVQVDKALLAEVQDLVYALTKTLKIFRTYPRENSISVNAIGELAQTFHDYLEKHTRLELFVDRHELQWQGVPVYSETDQRRSLALKLDRDGVRRLVFQEGIEQEEILGLLEALTVEINEGSLSDDLVTILWEKQLTHVKVYVLDQMSAGKEGAFDTDLVEGGEPVEQDDSPAEGVARRSLGASAPGPVPIPTEERDATAAGQSALCTATKAKVHPMSNQQTAHLHELAENEASNDISEDLADILFDILQTETHDQAGLNALKVMVELSVMHVKGLAFGRSADIIGKLRALAASDELGKEIRSRIVEQLQSLADPLRVETVVETLREHEQINKTELSRFLTMLPTAAAPGLCPLMELDRYADVVCQAVRYLIKDDPTVLTSKLSGSNIELALKVLEILEQVAEPTLAAALVDPLTTAETPVRRTSVKLLEALKGPDARDLLLEYVTGEDPSLRKAALKALGNFGEGSAAPLRQQVLMRDFRDRTLDEKKTLLVTLARLESHQAVEFLEEMLSQRKWFEKENHAETRACAALALGEIDSDVAREALEQHVSDKSEVVRTASRLALSRTGQSTAVVGT